MDQSRRGFLKKVTGAFSAFAAMKVATGKASTEDMEEMLGAVVDDAQVKELPASSSFFDDPFKYGNSGVTFDYGATYGRYFPMRELIEDKEDEYDDGIHSADRDSGLHSYLHRRSLGLREEGSGGGSKPWK